MFFHQVLHDADRMDCVFDLPQLALEFLDVLLDVAEGLAAGVAEHPRMVDDVFGFDALLVLDGQQLLHEVLGLETDLLPVSWVELDALGEDFLLELALVFGLKRRIPAKKDIKYDTDGPPIHLLVVLQT